MRKNLKVVQVSEVLYIVDIEADIVYNVSGYPLLYQCKRVEGGRVYCGDIISDAKEACERIIASVPNYSSTNENIDSVDVPRWTDTDMEEAYKAGNRAIKVQYTENLNIDTEEWLTEYKNKHHV